MLDERVHAFRRDIADIALAGQIFAPHYARPLMRRCGPRPAFMRAGPSEDALITSQLLPGEEFAALEMNGHWAWGYSRADHYVGYVELAALADPFEPTHIVTALDAPVFAEANTDAAPLFHLPMGARVRGEAKGGLLATHDGFLPLADIRAIDASDQDPVAVAERFLGAPYLLGGRTSHGMDCSGLIQVALGLCGTPAPRDSDQQQALGQPLADGAELKRGDLVFFEGHVGLMVDRDRLIHATAHAGAVVVEPFGDVAARRPIVARRRLS
ncbi:C40 family peptidase [Allosphingosinicella humi]